MKITVGVNITKRPAYFSVYLPPFSLSFFPSISSYMCVSSSRRYRDAPIKPSLPLSAVARMPRFHIARKLRARICVRPRANADALRYDGDAKQRRTSRLLVTFMDFLSDERGIPRRESICGGNRGRRRAGRINHVALIAGLPAAVESGGRRDTLCRPWTSCGPPRVTPTSFSRFALIKFAIERPPNGWTRRDKGTPIYKERRRERIE